MSRRGDGSAVLPLAVLILFTAALWWSAIAGHGTIINGDAIVHGLPLFSRLAAVLGGKASGDASLIWAPGVYGGHPLFAEGQGAFAEPLNLLFAGAVAPLTGVVEAENLLHVTNFLLTGLGVFALCRALGVGAWSGCFAALAVICSPLALGGEQNLTISGSLTYVPWALWLAQRWIAVPSIGRAVGLGCAFAALELAGYPQTVHATALYVAVLFAARLGGLAADWRARALSLAIGGGVAVGLSAVQWLPQVELIGQSVRSSGIGLFTLPPLTHLRIGPFDRDVLPFCGSLPLSLLVVAGCVLARGRPAVMGHVVAGLFLWLLGCGRGMPLFDVLYDHHLIAGLHAFRGTDMYRKVGAFGLCAVAGGGIDRLGARMRGGKRPAVGVFVVLAPLIGLTMVLDYRTDGWAAIALASLAALLPAVAIGMRRTALLPAALAGALCIEIGVGRAPLLVFHDRALLAVPAHSVVVRKAAPDWREYAGLDDTIEGTYAFIDADDPREIEGYQRMREAQSGMTSILDGTRNLQGALALILARRAMLDATLSAEARCADDAHAGWRPIDVLAIRWIAAYAPPTCRGFEVPEGAVHGIWTIENRAALPRIQLYDRHEAVGSPEAALAALRHAPSPLVVIEDPDHVARETDVPRANGGAARAVLVKDRATLQRIHVSSPTPVWLFVADADYPGWRASIDGRAVPVFAAQVLGKAVLVAGGAHDVTFRFVSRSLQAGLVISLATMTALLVAGGRRMRRSRRPV